MGRACVERVTLSRDERALIAMWADGAPHTAISSRLGISERTLSRMARDLRRRLGVETQFQLGLLLGRAEPRRPPPPEDRNGPVVVRRVSPSVPRQSRRQPP